jgi:hypothetical protein
LEDAAKHDMDGFAQSKSDDETRIDTSAAAARSAERPTSSSSEASVNSISALMKTKNYTQIKDNTMSFDYSFPCKSVLNHGSRAFEAFVRPSPIAIAGKPIQYGFDMHTCSFSMSFLPFEDEPAEDAASQIFLPEYFFQDGEPDIEVSSGRFDIHRAGQLLRWWHAGSGEQTLRISSSYTRHGLVGTGNKDTEGWYYWNGNCQIM